MRFGFLLLSILSIPALAQDLRPIEIYTQDELLSWIQKNTHLTRVVEDDCQLVQDIKDRAVKVSQPAYQFLWGDMLAYGVCVDKNVQLGVYYMRQAADQGLPEGLEQMGRYYHIGRFVQPNINQAIIYLREAAALGNLNAQLRLVELFCNGYGSPYDYEDAYHQLFHAVIGDKEKHKKAGELLAKLAKRMPDHVVTRAQKPR